MQSDGRLANVSAALLIGGESSRMGRDKAQLELDGVPFATRIAQLLDDLFCEVLLVGGSPPADAPGRHVPDPETFGTIACALRGVVSALDAAREERVVVVATDLPNITPELLLGLTAWPERDAVVPRGKDGMHPLCAIYRRVPVFEVARRRLRAGDRKLQGLLAELDTEFLEGADLAALDPEGRALHNVNTPEDLERLLASHESATRRGSS